MGKRKSGPQASGGGHPISAISPYEDAEVEACSKHLCAFLSAFSGFVEDSVGKCINSLSLCNKTSQNLVWLRTAFHCFTILVAG